ncbi:hypothetical protein [Dactylosporangium sp. CA-139066]|uniref:hypothetical protein n=1 Tax=Dactylosporangium sp. CA-139066 TaxID=3239930 RepID=UPI003D8C2CA0
MYLVSLAIAPTGSARLRALTAAQAVEFFRRDIGIDDQLEHVSARAGPDRVHLGFFVRTPEGNAREFCLRVLAKHPELAGWHLIE